jgi:hypothetical protein
MCNLEGVDEVLREWFPDVRRNPRNSGIQGIKGIEAVLIPWIPGFLGFLGFLINGGDDFLVWNRPEMPWQVAGTRNCSRFARRAS